MIAMAAMGALSAAGLTQNQALMFTQFEGLSPPFPILHPDGGQTQPHPVQVPQNTTTQQNGPNITTESTGFKTEYKDHKKSHSLFGLEIGPRWHTETRTLNIDIKGADGSVDTGAKLHFDFGVHDATMTIEDMTTHAKTSYPISDPAAYYLGDSMVAPGGFLPGTYGPSAFHVANTDVALDGQGGFVVTKRDPSGQSASETIRGFFRNCDGSVTATDTTTNTKLI